jgi:hypothetical protein
VLQNNLIHSHPEKKIIKNNTRNFISFYVPIVLQNNLPGPGTYGKGGIPHTLLEEKAQRSTSTKGMLEAHCGSRGQPLVVSARYCTRVVHL